MDLPFQMNLDLSPPNPTGYFLVGDRRRDTIVRNGNEIVFKFSEYGAEMRGTWDGREWKGSYLRIRSAGTKSFKFSALPQSAASNTY